MLKVCYLTEGGGTYKKILGVLSELGYDVEWEVLNSKDVGGVPQNRERLYIKGYFREKCGGEILSQKRDCREVSVQRIRKLIDGRQATAVYSIDGTPVTLTGCGGGMGGKTRLYTEPTLKPHSFDRQVKKRVHDVDYAELSDFLRKHKKDSGLSNKAIAAQVDKPVSEVEHWFRTDKFFAPPTDDVWIQLKEILGIESDKYDDFMLEFEWVDGVFEQDKRAYGSDGLSPTLTTKGESLVLDSDEVKVDDPQINVVGNVGNTNHGGENVLDSPVLSSTLTANNYKHPVKIIEKDESVIRLKTNTEKGYDEVTEGDGVRLCHPSSKLARGRSQKGQTGALSTSSDWGTVERDYRIRRLTPLECERLQAFPDGWTEFGADGERISDTQRYKCLGNAVTTTVVTFIANDMFRSYFESNGTD